jgi:CHAT domain-containing protein
LASARAVHVFTHGQQCAYAAAFHALYLAPDEAAATDGILRAYEILPLRCSGLEVLTLSACESALGRFDAGDNLTGLPGSLFLAGVQRVVGTLWPVSSAVANCFFEAFYGALGDDRRYASAFRQAQLAARDLHPEYRDWGAFYFMGPPGA